MEILSPASNINHIKVAIDSKANAVYGGLQKWNARNKAINFSTEEYNLLIEELHKNNIKFFLTLNILMLDDEIEEVINFLKHNKLPDSFIVTDLGLISRLKQEFPNVPLHFSTQFGSHNLDDVNFIKSIGGTRAILARELTLQEVEKIRNNTDLELECFIWGSQCLSFSGLCFFGTLINGGGGNRGKCIITCRDVYSVNDESGHYLYVPDMDCINLISRLDNIDCLKLEGRRRDPEEIKQILNNIHKKILSKVNTGYLYGENISSNHLYEKINSRTKPTMLAKELYNISDNDICIEYKNGIPVRFSKNYQDPNVKYIYTEIKKDYSLTKKNISIDIIFKDNHLSEVLYVNYKGDGHTFFENLDDEDLIVLDLKAFDTELMNNNNMINLYKIKYKRKNYDKYYISKKIYKEMIQYILEDCKNNQIEEAHHDILFKQIYLETQEIDVIDNFINDDFVKVIYDIGTIDNLKNIQKIINKYSDRIIYKLPLFNWKSEDVKKYINLLENKEIMFTRLSQLYCSKNIKFKKKYIDYTIYVWNKESLKFLRDLGIQEFTASPELSYEINKSIFEQVPMQVILCGKLPLVYSRGCFKHLFGCEKCLKEQKKLKNIKNIDKNLDFEILCNNDFRYILCKNPILNDFSKVELNTQTSFRYVALGQSLELINSTINYLKRKNYFEEMKKNDFWKNSYECNLLESKD